MPSTPLICSSIGATTVAATTSALAPGYWPDMLMVGGAISGYCAIEPEVTPPRITITIESRGEKSGRLRIGTGHRVYFFCAVGGAPGLVPSCTGVPLTRPARASCVDDHLSSAASPDFIPERSFQRTSSDILPHRFSSSDP